MKIDIGTSTQTAIKMVASNYIKENQTNETYDNRDFAQLKKIFKIMFDKFLNLLKN